MPSPEIRFTGYGREDLIDRILYLETEVGLTKVESRSGWLCKQHALSPSHIRLLLSLHDAKGRILSASQLMEATGSEAEETKTITVMICQIRERCGANVITTHPGFGYSISPRGVELVSRARTGVAA